MLWAGVSTNVLIRRGRILQVLFCWKKPEKTDRNVGTEQPPWRLQVGKDSHVLCVIFGTALVETLHFSQDKIQGKVDVISKKECIQMSYL